MRGVLTSDCRVYRALVAGTDQPFSGLQDPVLTADSATLTIEGKLAGLPFVPEN